MTPLKFINERYSSNIAFVFESGATLLSSKLDSKVKNHPGSDIKARHSVTDEFSIAWMVIQLGQLFSKKEDLYCHKLNGSKDTFKLLTDAQIIQWNEFCNSEIRPFLCGLLSDLSQNQTRDVIYANRLRND